MSGDGNGERGSMTEEALRIVVAGRRAGKSQREIAIDLYGHEQVEACWHADSRMRSQVRRLLCRADGRSGAGPDGAAPVAS